MNPILKALETADRVIEANRDLERISAQPVIKLWQVSIVGDTRSWHGTVEALTALAAEDTAKQAAHEEGFPYGGRLEAYVTFLPAGRKVCPACNGQHDRPGRFCSPCINDGDAEIWEAQQ